MAIVSNLLSRVRLELGDLQKQFEYTATGDGSTKSFNLGYKPVELSSLYVTVGGVAKTYPTNYTLEEEAGVIHFTVAPAASAAIVITGLVNRYFLDDDLCQFINDALTQHTYNRTDAFGSLVTIANLPAVEEYPLAILAVIEALWALATDSAFDINITAPDGVIIPRSQRYSQLTSLITQRWDQYKQLCAALNIGLWKIEMGTLRRVSRTTNKLVPIYVAQEIDDSRRPERAYIQNDLLGRSPMASTAQIYDIALYQGDSWEAEFDFPFNTTGITFKAQIRTYPGAPSLYGTFTITTISTSSTLSRIKLSLVPSTTKYMPVRAFWDLQATAASDPDYEQTYIKGQVFTTQQVTVD